MWRIRTHFADGFGPVECYAEGVFDDFVPISTFRVTFAPGVPMALPRGGLVGEVHVIGRARPLDAWRHLERNAPALGPYILRVERVG